MTNERSNEQYEDDGRILVVGGGLAGLTAAVEAARAGRPVTLFEAASGLGGRAKTREVDGFRFNLGPRALYAGGAAKAVLDDLGVAYRGHRPSLDSPSALVEDRVELLPLGLGSLLTCPWLGFRERFEVAGLMARLPKTDPRASEGRSAADWVKEEVRGPGSRAFLRALLQLSTYCAELGRLEAPTAVHQLQTAISDGVLYLDGGWQTLVAGLRERALEAGAQVEEGARIVAVEEASAGVTCRTADGRSVRASAAILAVGPEIADRLLGSKLGDFSRRARACRPVRAACLDVALRRLPRPDRTFALGIDGPFYVSVHSASADLAPEGCALIHVLRYLRAGESLNRALVEQELEDVLDRLQPGWREHLVDRQLLPQMVVCHDLPAPERKMTGTRVSSRIHVAGDWVGDEGLLADAAVASGRRAARELLQYRSIRREARSA